MRGCGPLRCGPSLSHSSGTCYNYRQQIVWSHMGLDTLWVLCWQNAHSTLVNLVVLVLRPLKNTWTWPWLGPQSLKGLFRKILTYCMCAEKSPPPQISITKAQTSPYMGLPFPFTWPASHYSFQMHALYVFKLECKVKILLTSSSFVVISLRWYFQSSSSYSSLTYCLTLFESCSGACFPYNIVTHCLSTIIGCIVWKNNYWLTNTVVTGLHLCH